MKMFEIRTGSSVVNGEVGARRDILSLLTVHSSHAVANREV